MELQTPEHFSRLIQDKAFGCSSSDVPWQSMGFEGKKLEYLNFKLGYFYDGHRALTDCWATLNLFVQHPDAFNKLKASVRKKSYLICALDANFNKKDDLKTRGYRWSSGDDHLPKTWWIIVDEQNYEDELNYLKDEIFNGREKTLPTKSITAKIRFSYRAEIGVVA